MRKTNLNSCYLIVINVVLNMQAMKILNGLLNIHFYQELSKNGISSGTVSAHSLEIFKKKLSIYLRDQ